ncbi:DNA polymerase IV [Terribacillus saccharophilus]|uniref:DNA polymerase IV n=1 Tax=Terribacillus saccharophilus TaxID=361277 RepID=UPI0039822186
MYQDISESVKTTLYKQKILQFAKQAKKALFESSQMKKPDEEFDKEMYEDFWEEYDYLLQKHKAD